MSQTILEAKMNVHVCLCFKCHSYSLRISKVGQGHGHLESRFTSCGQLITNKALKLQIPYNDLSEVSRDSLF